MFRVISAIVFFIVLFLTLAFFFENFGAFSTEVTMKYDIILFKIYPVQVPVWLLLLFMWGMGIAMTFFLELIGFFKNRSRIIQLTRTIRRLEKETKSHGAAYHEPIRPEPKPKDETTDKKRL